MSATESSSSGGGEILRQTPGIASTRHFTKQNKPSNAVYEGYVDEAGRRDGQGTYIDKKRNRYQGEWVKDKSHGYGVKKFATGDVHEGYYVEDKRHGWGMYTWKNGDKYVGLWLNGLMHGEGTFFWAHGDTYQGMFKNGNMEGKGLKRLADGGVYDGDWKNNKTDGRGMKKFPAGDTHRGFYANDTRQGFGFCKFVVVVVMVVVVIVVVVVIMMLPYLTPRGVLSHSFGFSSLSSCSFCFSFFLAFQMSTKKKKKISTPHRHLA